MKRLSMLGVVAILSPTFAYAHVTVRPRESKPGIEERYTVRVPTEGAVATTSVHIEILTGVTVLEVEKTDGATFETQKSMKSPRSGTSDSRRAHRPWRAMCALSRRAQTHPAGSHY